MKEGPRVDYLPHALSFTSYTSSNVSLVAKLQFDSTGNSYSCHATDDDNGDNDDGTDDDTNNTGTGDDNSNKNNQAGNLYGAVTQQGRNKGASDIRN